MRSLASIQKIADLQPIPEADAIEVATVLGWHVVVKKNEFKVGDLCVYFEVDSLLPKLPVFEFLADRGTKQTLGEDGKMHEGYRLKTVKLRGQVSQGLVFPVGDFAAYLKVQDIWKVGTDVTQRLGVIKYEPPMPGELFGIAKGNLPGDIPKTDETRIQSMPAILKRWEFEPMYVTEKVDGSSCTVYFENGELNVTGRTINWDRASNNSYWQAALACGIEDKADKLGDIVLQGELMGEGVQGNKLKIKGKKLFFFNAMHRKTGEYLNFSDFTSLCNELKVETVPLVTPNILMKAFSNIDELVEYATRRSLINPEVWAEGIVIRPLEEKKDPNLGRLSFKVINPKFLLKYEE